jgi:hypothetical protein
MCIWVRAKNRTLTVPVRISSALRYPSRQRNVVNLPPLSSVQVFSRVVLRGSAYHACWGIVLPRLRQAARILSPAIQHTGGNRGRPAGVVAVDFLWVAEASRAGGRRRGGGAHGVVPAGKPDRLPNSGPESYPWPTPWRLLCHSPRGRAIIRSLLSIRRGCQAKCATTRT